MNGREKLTDAIERLEVRVRELQWVARYAEASTLANRVAALKEARAIAFDGAEFRE